jgi:hypothetical protein
LDADRLAVLFNRSARGIFLDWCVEDVSFDLVTEGFAVMRDFIISALQKLSSFDALRSAGMRADVILNELCSAPGGGSRGDPKGTPQERAA